MFQRIKTLSTYKDVKVCDRWLSYDNFFEDMSPTWKKGLTLDKDLKVPGNRIYGPEYCQWVSRSENAKEVYNRLGSPINIPEIRKKATLAAAKVNINNKNAAKKYICIETGEVITDAGEYERKHNLSRGSISNAANPKSKNQLANGYHWEYIKE